MIEIVENYKDYAPHPRIRKSVKRIVSNVPPKRLFGLKAIILTNTKALNHKRRRQKIRYGKRKVHLNQCLGWYTRKWNNNPASIELMIDNIFNNFPEWLYYFNFFVDFTLTSTVFHEIGHHIHKSQAPEFKNKEIVAEKWRDQLSRDYFSRKYRYIILPVKLVFFLVKKLKGKTNR